MMRRLFVFSTLAFWGCVSGLWAASHLVPAATPVVPVADPPVVTAAATPVVPQAATPDKPRTITAAELARHNTEKDCWMAIDGQVYDLTAYLPNHPSEPEIVLPWCGKEASQAYHTKTKGRPHTPRADAMLPKYRIGVLAPK